MERLEAKEKGIKDLTGLEKATGLTTLELHDNRISDIKPIADLTNLTELIPRRKSNQRHHAPRWINETHKIINLPQPNQGTSHQPRGLTKLKELWCRKNQISNIKPLAGLAQLTELSLSNNPIGDITPLAGLTKLEKLYLTENQIRDIKPLTGLTQLTTLWLDKNQISDITGTCGIDAGSQS